MAIANVVQRGSWVYVYNEKNQVVFTRSVSGPGSGVKGYTSSVVSIQQGNFIYTYDERGNCQATINAR